MRPNRHCCGQTTDPSNECPAGQLRLPASITIDHRLRNATGLVTISNSQIGRHEVQLQAVATTPAAPWCVLGIVWCDDLQGLDPHEAGTITRAIVSGRAKLIAQSGWKPDQGDNPSVVVGIVIDQAGNEYFALTDQADLIAPLINKCCWRGLSGGSNPLELCLPIHAPLSTQVTDDTMTWLSGGGPMCSDLFGTLQPDGTINTDERPDLDLGLDSHPITRFGIVLGLRSVDTAGTYDFTALTGPLCGQLSVADHFRTELVGSTHQPPGTIVIDEPLTSLPAGWETSNYIRAAPVIQINDNDQVEGGGYGARFTSRDGIVVQEELRSNGLDEYCCGSAWIEVPFTRTTFDEDFSITLETLWRRVREEDRSYITDDGWKSTEIRSQVAGLFVGGWCRFLLGHHLQTEMDPITGLPTGNLDHGATLTYTQALHRRGGLYVPRFDRIAPAANIPPGFPCPCDPDPCPGFPNNSFGTNQSISYAKSCPNISIQDGTHMALKLYRRANLSPRGCLLDQWADHQFHARLWVNGIEIAHDWNANNYGWLWPNTPFLRIGVISLYGGAWERLRCWIN